MWACKNYDGDVQSDSVAQGRYCFVDKFMRPVRTLCMVLRIVANSPVHTNGVINYAIRLLRNSAAYASQKLFQE